jgi:hypothetical protein
VSGSGLGKGTTLPGLFINAAVPIRNSQICVILRPAFGRRSSRDVQDINADGAASRRLSWVHGRGAERPAMKSSASREVLRAKAALRMTHLHTVVLQQPQNSGPTRMNTAASAAAKTRTKRRSVDGTVMSVLFPEPDSPLSLCPQSS